MQPSVAILNTIMTVPKEERWLLFRLIREDTTLLQNTLQELTRLRRIAESGSRKAWEKVKRKRGEEMRSAARR